MSNENVTSTFISYSTSSSGTSIINIIYFVVYARRSQPYCPGPQSETQSESRVTLALLILFKFIINNEKNFNNLNLYCNFNYEQTISVRVPHSPWSSKTRYPNGVRDAPGAQLTVGDGE